VAFVELFYRGSLRVAARVVKKQDPRTFDPFAALFLRLAVTTPPFNLNRLLGNGFEGVEGGNFGHEVEVDEIVNCG
jgi:hypothetical protein